MADSFPMIVRCAARQPDGGLINRCACGELKRAGYWQCAGCQMKAAAA